MTNLKVSRWRSEMGRLGTFSAAAGGGEAGPGGLGSPGGGSLPGPGSKRRGGVSLLPRRLACQRRTVSGNPLPLVAAVVGHLVGPRTQPGGAQTRRHTDSETHRLGGVPTRRRTNSDLEAHRAGDVRPATKRFRHAGPVTVTASESRRTACLCRRSGAAPRPSTGPAGTPPEPPQRAGDPSCWWL